MRLHVQRRERPPAAEGGTLRGREIFRQISSRIRLPRNSRDLLHAANLRHGTDGFTSPPKEGVLRIFSPLKIRRLRPGLNPRTWVPKASTLPLDHRSRSVIVCQMENNYYVLTDLRAIIFRFKRSMQSDWFILKMKALGSFETSVTLCQPSQHNMLEDWSLRQHHCEGDELHKQNVFFLLPNSATYKQQ